MITCKFNVERGNSPHVLIISGKDKEEALEKATELNPKGARISLIMRMEGTIENYLGPETLARIAKAKATAKEKKASDKRRYNKVQKAAESA